METAVAQQTQHQQQAVQSRQQQQQQQLPQQQQEQRNQHFYHTESPPYLDLDMERVNLASDYCDDYDCIYDLDLLSLIHPSPINQQHHNLPYHQSHQDLANACAAAESRPASLSSSYLSDYVSEQFDMLSTPNHHHQHAYNQCNNCPQLTQPQQYLSIEDLQTARNSCSLCGCNWQQDHVSLDCSECGGYSLTRPCPECDGKCKTMWKRNIATTHDRHRATWVGQCALNKKSDMKTLTSSPNLIVSPKDLCQALSNSQNSDIDDCDFVDCCDDDEMRRHCPSPAASYDSGDYSSSPAPSPPQYRQQQSQQQQTNSDNHRTTNKILVARINC